MPGESGVAFAHVKDPEPLCTLENRMYKISTNHGVE